MSVAVIRGTLPRVGFGLAQDVYRVGLGLGPKFLPAVH